MELESKKGPRIKSKTKTTTVQYIQPALYHKTQYFDFQTKIKLQSDSSVIC